MTPHRQITPDWLKRLFAWGMAKANTADNVGRGVGKLSRNFSSVKLRK